MREETYPSTYWHATAQAPGFPKLAGEMHVDVAVVGGGIVGITTARALKDLGLKTAVIEARKVGQEVTGRSTAKVTSQHRLLYQTLEQKFGEDAARLYAELQQSALRTIIDLAAQHGIDCDIESRPAFTYTCEERHVAEIEAEAEIAKRLGLPATLLRRTELPFKTLAALRFDDQAQFHPIKYVAGLARSLPGEGCHVFEDSRVIDWSPNCVATEGGKVTATHVVMATHLPLGQIGAYYAKAYPYAEPVIAAPIGRVPSGMYINVERPTRSIRTHTGPDGRIYGIAVGTAFKPGQPDEERRAFEDIESWLVANFAAGPIEYRWVNEDYTSIDRAPFIGWSSSAEQGYLVATGFGAWGITNGTAAGLILADLAVGRDNRWTGLFDPQRLSPIAGGPRFAAETAGVVAHLVKTFLPRKAGSFEDLATGEAAILKIGGEKVAAFRDESGEVHVVSAHCTHMGCMLGWNATDRTWDCHCHGSRFGLSGEVIHGPAVESLSSPELDMRRHTAQERVARVAGRSR